MVAGDELAGRIAELVRPTIEAMGFDLVRAQVLGRQRMRVQIMAERGDGTGMTVDDCALLSRAVSAVLDVDDPITGSYILEVSSPGIDRPLVRIEDYRRFAGFEARLELGRLVDGRKRLQGRLVSAGADMVRIDVGGVVKEIDFADIRRAKLVLTDDLLAAHAKPAAPGDTADTAGELEQANGNGREVLKTQ
ncbi:MAG: ribosome maturation factor RimP [Rhodospirillales bacterium]